MKWLQFILSHSIFIALCAAALSFQTLQLLQLPVNAVLILFIFFATLCSYNGYWLLSKYSFTLDRKLFIAKEMGHVVMIALALVGMVYCMLRLHLVWYNIIIAAFLLGIYAIPLLPIRQFYFTRKAGFLKTIVLAFTWAHVTTLVPLQIPFTHMQLDAWLIFFNRFLFVLLLCIIFDNRDAAVDKIRGLHSLATDVRSGFLKYIMIGLFVLYFMVVFVSYTHFITLSQSIALLVTGVAAMLLFYAAQKKRNYFFYYFLVDGLMLFSAIATYIASI